MYRDVCPQCRRPRESCLCSAMPAMVLRTKIVLLMHPKEWRRERCGTGRLTCLNIADAELLPGIAFDDHPRVRELIDNPVNFPVLLYPGTGSIDLSDSTLTGLSALERRKAVADLKAAASGRRITAFLVDATWACSKAVLRESPCLLTLPRLMFTPQTPSRWIIKRQPGPLCLSTLETVHELLCALESVGLEDYPDKERLLDVFARMQEYQIERAVEGGKPRHFAKRM
ncbi:MAG: tRNA-uridine aminocarboxypropyltransferase [Rectinemataceae bacterium]|nr:tRNA-uridine aminocarboxypropyltransferase [Rectinemataceae bacterium]